jgi:Cu+-exporting ATPase
MSNLGQVIRVITFNGYSEEAVLKLAAIGEKLSEHSLGKVILERARELNPEVPDAEEFKVIPEQGVSARFKGSVILIGTEKLIKENQISVLDREWAALKEMEQDGLTPMLVAYSGKVAGIIGLADSVRKEMREAIKSLKSSGARKAIMLTGDSPEVARRVAAAIRIDEWRACLLPQQKVEAIKKLQNEGYKVAMIGDGINDAPALAQADVGIAIGLTGTDIAMEASNIVLPKDDTLSAAESIHLSCLTLRTINQNLIFALLFNLLGIVLASIGILSSIASALFHNFGSVAVVVNSARLIGIRSSAQWAGEH